MGQRSTRFAEGAEQLQKVSDRDGVVEVDIRRAVRHAPKVRQQEQHVFHAHHAVARQVAHARRVGRFERHRFVTLLVQHVVEENEEHFISRAFAKRDILGRIVGIEGVGARIVVGGDAMKGVACWDLGQCREGEEALPIEVPRRN